MLSSALTPKTTSRRNSDEGTLHVEQVAVNAPVRVNSRCRYKYQASGPAWQPASRVLE